MDFIHGDAVLLGMCSNLSQSGLRGTFSEHVAPGSEGLLTLYFEEHQVEVQARIDSRRDDEVRVKFQFKSDKERSAMSELVNLLTLRASRKNQSPNP
jgi:hypothetical protein